MTKQMERDKRLMQSSYERGKEEAARTMYTRDEVYDTLCKLFYGEEGLDEVDPDFINALIPEKK